MSDEPVLALAGITRQYRQGGAGLTVLAEAGLTVAGGEAVALVAPSGAGKSTLLHIAGLLERPDAGRVILQGTDATRLRDRRRTRLRRDTVGFVYQFHHLLPEFSAEENLIVPQMIAGRRRARARERARYFLERVGLTDRRSHRPARLSGGEQQRVAIARALVNRPAVLLADEPTGNLDPETSQRVFALLLSLVRDEGLAALVATHNHALASRLDRRLNLMNGHVVDHYPTQADS